MTAESWSQQAERAILESLAQTVGKTDHERTRAVDAAYPFGQRSLHPYKQWLKVRKRLLFKHGVFKPTPHEHIEAPLFDPNVGQPKPVEET